ncbi:DUF6799 domain-containing protein [Hymenobacter sp. DG25A]|uniref:DUF6799 domain-containing protein n=1 Tax=Hymenobacter sp. DG25A TaxID=1385663 RepID=UPI0006BC5100|nr:DUF6799 domain-containing protein [Hymenobacter sp. DG25A]ALD21834.1 hypothetical protein AM218_12265 [Hymenobacter sp. DG25A]
MLRTTILGFLAVFCLNTAASAQTQPTTQGQQAVRVSLKDGAFRRKGVMMRIQSGKITRLTSSFQLTNGTTVYPDGHVVTTNGTRQQLPDGRAINMQGEIVGLSDDMLTAATIQQLDQMVTGYTGTVISLPNAVPAEAATALQRLERKAALLEQLTDRLAQRTAQAVPVSPEAARLDAQINALAPPAKP